ncbi:hypothetical protein RJ640_010433 [Escallonia rubra]|uniref:GAG-pre-integrase domain-containing protein n=1 Tax=Escallonia rubra TaxID=112253 RepID=A0AA88USC5_9ASTE|nr:hypothetical protein RJ640_010433 [Escallonia rubra]
MGFKADTTIANQRIGDFVIDFHPARISSGDGLFDSFTIFRWDNPFPNVIEICSGINKSYTFKDEVLIYNNFDTYIPFLKEMEELVEAKSNPEEALKTFSVMPLGANRDVKCLSAISETSWLWHRRLGHMHMEHLKDISSKELVRGLPKIKFEKDKSSKKQNSVALSTTEAEYMAVSFCSAAAQGSLDSFSKSVICSGSIWKNRIVSYNPVNTNRAAEVFRWERRT